MKQPHGIIVFGANGSGKTTLARELARRLNYKFMDMEDYYFEETEIPYTVKRSHEDCIQRMLADMGKHQCFVLAAVTGDLGDTIPLFYDCAVFVSAPPELRLERVKQRSYARYGERVRHGGDMYEQEQRFYEFVATRPLSKIEEWASTLTCPVIPVDGTADWRLQAEMIAHQYLHISEHP